MIAVNEAIERLKCMRLFMQITDRDNLSRFDEEDYEANAMAINALEKQIPEKPYIQSSDYGEIQVDCYECPDCDSFLGYVSDCEDEHYRDDYCRNCGKAIDWSDCDV